MAQVRLIISEIIGNTNFVDEQDAHKVYERLYECFKNGDSIILSFEGVQNIFTAFTNVAVGQLYNEFRDTTIRRQLRFEGLPEDPLYRETLNLSIRRAKQFYKDKQDNMKREGVKDADQELL